MTALHRHQIAHVRESAWDRLLRADWDAQARSCLAHWAERGLPLVVTRQPADLPEGEIAMGLCAPARWGHRRLALRVRWAEVLYFDEFPRLDQLVTQLPRGTWAAARELVAALRACGATARVFGSHGWQALSGLPHVREGSDLDVWVAVDGPVQADAAAAAMQAFEAPARRLDGELVLAGDAAIAWREWRDWRSGRVSALLVKRLRGPSLGPLTLTGPPDRPLLVDVEVEVDVEGAGAGAGEGARIAVDLDLDPAGAASAGERSHAVGAAEVSA
ncbi:malonate decarboxylase holo-[acyl-carrier-protein] synthase [Roseateles chitosanitabidus]|uniref:malonate decarboxylase holo-[acyl-carrier-protein] synthase n=1 Tax=Roseateles chitosanitabidus TaxID=65048 RepID=UPI00082BD2BC|nr:malonate decarboxylase holo-[acyl-carrier-protein] synthase [Roseateles chitosanitabidus]